MSLYFQVEQDLHEAKQHRLFSTLQLLGPQQLVHGHMSVLQSPNDLHTDQFAPDDLVIWHDPHDKIRINLSRGSRACCPLQSCCQALG